MKLEQRHWRWYLLTVLIVAGALIWFGVWSTKEKNYVSVTFLNVGEGDAVLIEGKNGNQILVDGGPGRETLAQLSKVVPFFDRMINSVIETYPDKDNGGGLPYVLRQYSVGAFFSSPAAIQSSIDDEIARITTEKHIPIQTLSSRMVFDLHDGSYLKVLSPSNDSNMKTSDASLVLEYVYNKTCFLIMGDAPEKTENDLAIKFGDTLHCQVLRVGHHGAKTSTGDALLSAVTPDYAIFSNSKDNRYAYPDQEVLDRLAGHNIKILNTKDSGTIKMISNGQTVSRI